MEPQQSLSDYIERKRDRRDPDSKGATIRQPEWRRRAIEAHEQNPWSAVTDLTDVGAA